MKIQKLKAMLITMVVIACSAVIFSCDDDEDTPIVENTYTISGTASGSQVVPAVAGSGTGTITGTYDQETRELTYTNTWSGLTGAPTTGGFYYGATGVNGTMVGSPWTYDVSTTESGSASGTMTLTEAQEDQLLAGDWYYGYSTVANVDGEVRGQITTTEVD
jgi:hypothetical protein